MGFEGKVEPQAVYELSRDFGWPVRFTMPVCDMPHLIWRTSPWIWCLFPNPAARVHRNNQDTHLKN